MDLCIQVVDTGIGITQTDLSNMFKPYYRSTDSVSQNKNKNGHGLGLSICKNIVQCMGGTLRVASVIGVGTTFTICLKSELYSKKNELLKVSIHITISNLGEKVKDGTGQAQKEIGQGT